MSQKTNNFNNLLHLINKKKDYIFLFVVCTLFTILGVCLTRNEVFLDDWYIESSVDGLFGESNRSLWVVGTNYLLTSIIYALSLTGIRLSWFHLMMVLFNYISSVMVCTMIIRHIKGKAKYIISLLFLAIITPFVFFYLQFTTTAAYVIAAGCLWLFESIEQNSCKLSYLFGGFWIILGAAMRIDCVYFSLYFMGLVWLIKIVSILWKQHKRKNIKSFWRTFLHYFLPFFLTLVLVFGIELSQRILMNHINPGFSKWNSVRCLIDDYTIPDYLENSEAYQKLGISFNDYQLLKSWNNLDPDFFTEELYQKILELKDSAHNETVKNSGLFSCITYTMQGLSGNILLWGFLLALFCCFFFFDSWITVGTAVLLGGIIVLTSYFSYTGRLIWRTEWPIWTVAVIALLVLLCHQEVKLKINLSKTKRFILSAIACGFLLFAVPAEKSTTVWDPYKGLSLCQIYVTRFENPDNFIRYFKHKLFKEPTIQYDTFDGDISVYMENKKEIFFYRLWTRSWLQQYPLTDRDIFRTAPVGAGENWGSLGQYILRLQPLENNLKSYGIDNPFQDLVNENIRVVVKDNELKDRTWEINQYLKEHYYDDVNFSVDDIVKNAVIGRYIRNFDTTSMNVASGFVTLSYTQQSEYRGMAKIELTPHNITGFHMSSDESYIQLISATGETFTYALFEKEQVLQTYFYNDILIPGSFYNVNFIYKTGSDWYVVNNAAVLQTNVLYSDYSLETLDFSQNTELNYTALTGYFEREAGYAWTQKYSTVRIKNASVSTEGLLLKLDLPEYATNSTVPIKIYINSSCVYELLPQKGSYDIWIPAELIKNNENQYFVEIECPYFINPAIKWGEPDTRDLSVKIYYIGNPSSYINTKM